MDVLNEDKVLTVSDFQTLGSEIEKIVVSLVKAENILRMELDDKFQALNDLTQNLSNWQNSSRESQVQRYIDAGFCVGTVFRFKDAEYKVVGIDAGNFIVADPENKRFRIPTNVDMATFHEQMGKIKIIRKWNEDDLYSAKLYTMLKEYYESGGDCVNPEWWRKLETVLKEVRGEE